MHPYSFFAAPLLAGCSLALVVGPAAAIPPQVNGPSTVFVELFTSEGCSSCPPADELLRRVNGQHTSQGALIIGLSEHVSYWNGLGWQDPFSAQRYTDRQSSYADRFGTAGPYTPQMVVNGRQEFVGSDAPALEEAVQRQPPSTVALHIEQLSVAAGTVTVRFTAGPLPTGALLDLVVALVDDADRSSVRRGENAGRSLDHVFVARALMPLGRLHSGAAQSTTFAVPPALLGTPQPRHIVLFAQTEHLGPIVGAALAPLIP